MGVMERGTEGKRREQGQREGGGGGVNKGMETVSRMMVGRRFTGEEAEKTARKEDGASVVVNERPSAKTS